MLSLVSDDFDHSSRNFSVVYLGDQLESVNTPRARAVEALKLIKHFDEFLEGETSVAPVFMDKSRLVHMFVPNIYKRSSFAFLTH